MMLTRVDMAINKIKPEKKQVFNIELSPFFHEKQ